MNHWRAIPETMLRLSAADFFAALFAPTLDPAKVSAETFLSRL